MSTPDRGSGRRRGRRRGRAIGMRGPHPGSTGECTCVGGSARWVRGWRRSCWPRGRRRWRRSAPPARRPAPVPAHRAEEGEQAGRDHHLALDDPRRTRTTLQQLTDQFNSSQSDVKVNLVNQIDYVETFNKYKAGLSSGDLPDIVQLQETDQQQMIDTQTVLPASVCAKADKYSFSDFLPRVISYFTVEGTQYAMPFNTSGPVLYYNKKAFTAAGLDPNKPPDDARRRARRRREAQGQRRVGAARAQDRPGLLRALACARPASSYVNNSNGRQGPCHQDGLRRRDRPPDLHAGCRAW